MKKIITLLIISTTYIFANLNAVVSIAPEMTFVKAIGGDKVDVSLMVQVGNSPHTYEPKPSQMTAIAKADLYFAIGVEFENVWLPKFHSINKKMHIVNLSKGIKKIDMLHKHHNIDEHKDPHIWTSPENVKIISKNIFKALTTIDPANSKYYKNNLNNFLININNTDKEIKKYLSKLKKSHKFMVFHPSWGYFAKDYNLTQIAIEVEGKNPKPRELVAILKEAKKERISAIFTQPEFSDASAKIIANELHIPVIKVTPMAKNWSDNLVFIAKTIAGEN